MSRLSLTIDSCEFTYLKEVTKSLLNVILFHRLFGQIVPKTHELLDLTIPCVDDPDVERVIEDKVSAFVKSLEASGTNAHSVSRTTRSVVIEFYEKRMRKNWFTKTEEEVCWESWTINASLIPPSNTEQERRDNLKGLGQSLERAIMTVLRLVNERNNGYIPLIPYGEGNPFPYQIYHTPPE